MKRYFIYTSIILYLYVLAFSEMKYTSSILLSLKRNNLFQKSTSNILLSLHINLESPLQVYFRVSKQIHQYLKVCFKYTSDFKDKYISLESVLKTYF